MKVIRDGEIYEYGLTKHAIRRMTQRNISPIKVQQILSNGEKQEIKTSEFKYTLDMGYFILCVVTKEFNKDRIVITMFTIFKNRKRRRNKNEDRVEGSKIVYADKDISNTFTIGNICGIANSGNDC